MLSTSILTSINPQRSPEVSVGRMFILTASGGNPYSNCKPYNCCYLTERTEAS
jgi:hypothetical protein